MNPKTSVPFILAILFATVLLAFFPSVPRAQCGGCEPEGGIEPGAWALQFRVTDNFTLGNFQGSIVSAKYHFSKYRAIRFGVSGSLQAENGDASERDMIGDSLAAGYSIRDKGRVRSLGLNAQYLHYYAPQGRINAFIGAGPLLTYSWFSKYSHGQYGDRDNHQHRWTIGASALAGVEWFAARSISFHAEYGLSLARSWSRDEDVSTTYNPTRTVRLKSSDHSWDLSGSSVQLGLSVYL